MKTTAQSCDLPILPSKKMDPFKYLPPEICTHILSFLDPRHIDSSVVLVSRTWARICRDHHLWRCFSTSYVTSQAEFDSDMSLRRCVLQDGVRERAHRHNLHKRLKAELNHYRRNVVQATFDNYFNRMVGVVGRDEDVRLIKLMERLAKFKGTAAMLKLVQLQMEPINLLCMSITRGSRRCLPILHRWCERQAGSTDPNGRSCSCLIQRYGQKIFPALYLAVSKLDLDTIRILADLHIKCCSPEKYCPMDTNNKNKSNTPGGFPSLLLINLWKSSIINLPRNSRGTEIRNIIERLWYEPR